MCLHFVKKISSRFCHGVIDVFRALQMWQNTFARCTVRTAVIALCLTCCTGFSLTIRNSSVGRGQTDVQEDDILLSICQSVIVECCLNVSVSIFLFFVSVGTKEMCFTINLFPFSSRIRIENCWELESKRRIGIRIANITTIPNPSLGPVFHWKIHHPFKFAYTDALKGRWIKSMCSPAWYQSVLDFFFSLSCLSVLKCPLCFTQNAMSADKIRDVFKQMNTLNSHVMIL